MQADHRVDAIDSSGFDQLAGAALGHFFGRLEQQPDLAVDLVSKAGQRACNSEQDRGVPVVTTSMHLARHPGPKFEAVLLLDGKGIDVATNRHRWPRMAALQVADEAGR